MNSIDTSNPLPNTIAKSHSEQQKKLKENMKEVACFKKLLIHLLVTKDLKMVLSSTKLKKMNFLKF